MAQQYHPAANVPAGGRDTSDSPGPETVSDGVPVPYAVFHDGTGYVQHRTITADSGNAPQTSDGDRDNGLPDIPRYEGPAVPEQAALVNPSAGDIGEPGGGVNPRGPDVYSPGMTPDSVSSNYGDAPNPNTTKDLGTRPVHH